MSTPNTQNPGNEFWSDSLAKTAGADSIAEKNLAGQTSKDLSDLLGSEEKTDTPILLDPTNEDIALLSNALKNDKEGTNTAVEMIAVKPGDEEGFQRWMKKYTTIFTDPADMEDEETIRRNWEKGVGILYMVEGETKTEEGSSLRQEIGIRLAAVNPQVPDKAYVPYGGMDESFRGSLGYTRAMKHNEKDLAARGVNVVLNDCEDETRLAAFRESYKNDDGSQKSDDEIAKICQNRLHFFIKNGYTFVDDRDDEKGAAVKYRRPGSEDTKEIQAYDRLGFKFIANDAKYNQYFIKDADGNKTHITKEGYKAMYLSLHTLDQYSDMSESELRAEFPAIDSFLTDLEASPKTEFALYQDVVVDKK